MVLSYCMLPPLLFFWLFRYSIADSGTFSNVTEWLKDLVTSISEDIPILLIGNQLDLDKKNLRQVKKTDAQNFAKSRNLHFMEVSAKEGDNCVQAMQLILQSMAVYFGDWSISEIHENNSGGKKEEDKKDKNNNKAFTLGAKKKKDGDEEEEDEEDENCC